MSSLKGHLLIAAPQLTDPNFSRTVVLLLEHGDEGAFGVVLNRPSDTTVKEVWEQVGQEPTQSVEPINVGGPVPGPLMALHDSELLSEAEVFPGVHRSMQRDMLDQLVRGPAEFKLFSGYAGWGSGQLEAELSAGGWITRQANTDYIFYHHDDLWERVTKDITDEVLRPVLKATHVPQDPSCN
jgi:putative transcriptional regulator